MKKEEEDITREEVLEYFNPRPEPKFYERSFGAALIPTITSAIVIFVFSGSLKEWSDGSFSPAILIIPVGLVGSVILAASFRVGNSVKEKLQSAKVAAHILGALADERKEVQQAFLRLVMAFGQVMRFGLAEEEFLNATKNLSKAYDADKAASINGALPKLCDSLGSVVSSSIRTLPWQASLAYWIFLGALMLIPVFSGNKISAIKDLFFASNVATVALVYAFSLVFFVSKNIFQVFGTKGSQVRVSDTIKALL